MSHNITNKPTPLHLNDKNIEIITQIYVNSTYLDRRREKNDENGLF
jgi:hypothetical protein